MTAAPIIPASPMDYLAPVIGRDALLSSVELDSTFAEGKWGKGRAVSMNAHAEVSATARIYTVGLCGCRCTVAKRGDLIQLAHYCPLSTSRHVAALRAFRPESVEIWVPGEWVKDGERWKMNPEPMPPELLALCSEVHGYSECMRCGVEQMVDFNAGRVFAFGAPVTALWGQAKEDNRRVNHSPPITSHS